MAITGTASEHEAMEPGQYRARLTRLEEDEGQYGPFVKCFFEVIDDEDYAGESISGIASLKLTPDTKLWQWYSSLNGRPPEKGTEIDLEKIRGNECMLVVGHKTTDRGTFATIDAVHPVRRRRRGQEEASWPEPEDLTEEDYENIPF